ncbi:MAG TPA: hypothetical protein VFL60_05620, partial [Gaiellaceae bacterium]|nr:hypothetical protein [Gaiellaceae bacterium]
MVVRPRKRSRRGLRLAVAAALVLLIGAAAAVWAFSGVRLVPDASSLGRVELQPFAGSLAGVHATTADGSPVPLAVSHGRLIPRGRVASGERISVSVLVRRPGWESWALGAERRETLTVRTPVAHVLDRWVTADAGTRVVVRFDTPVDRVSLRGATVSGRTVTVPARTPAGSIEVAAAARPWERLGPP